MVEDMVLYKTLSNVCDSNMIDVLHSKNADLNPRFLRNEGIHSPGSSHVAEDAMDSAEESAVGESAWLRTFQAANAGSIDVKGLDLGHLAMDTSQLRMEPPTSAPRSSTRGKLPA